MPQLYPVSVVIPVFNQASYTAGCLNSLSRAEQRPAEVVIVDNGSREDTQELLRSWQTSSELNVVVHRFESNQGFSPACNTGAQLARQPNLVLLNNDTEVTDRWLSPLLEEIENPQVGVAGPKLVFPTSKIMNHAGYVFNSNLGAFYPLYCGVPADFFGTNKRRALQALLGACYAIKKDLYLAIGGFRELGLEDIDFCLQVRQSGRQVIYQPKSEIYHHGSVTLLNSGSDAIPAMDNALFSQYWPSNLLQSDDHIVYQEDGWNVELSSDGSLTLESLKDILTKLVELKPSS